MVIYHGSKQTVSHPEIRTSGFYKDFGFGFYCTLLERQAARWALAKGGQLVVNIYEYTPQPTLNILTFEEMTEEWLDFIVACRKGIPHPYDIAEGPMADDTIWNYIEDFISGAITREAFWALAKFRHPTHQIAFCTEKALSTLTFKQSYSL